MTALILTAARFPELDIPAAAMPPRGLVNRLATAIARRRTVKRLDKLDAEQLFDIGLSRSDINAIRAGQPVPLR